MRICFLLTLAVIYGCGSEGDGKKTAKPRGSAPLAGDTDKEGDDATGVARDGGAGRKSGGATPGDGDEYAGSETTDFAALASACGFSDVSQPQQDLLRQGLVGVPVTQSGSRQVPGAGAIDYTVTVSGSLALNANQLTATLTPQFSVIAQPAIVQNVANDEAAKRSGPITTNFLPFDQRLQLGDQSASWSGVVCTVQPGVKVTAELGGTRVVTEFNPPLPFLLSPKADAERYAAELGAERSWTGIGARVLQSTNPAVTAGATYSGTARVRAIAPVLEAAGDGGAPVRITADRAYELTYDFGGPEVTGALGLTPVMRFYINDLSKEYLAVVVEFGDATLPQAIYLAQ